MRATDVHSGALAGFEQWRTTVWGSEAVRSLGARFLPVPAEQDLRVDAGQVRAFRRECAVLRENPEEVLAGLRPPRTVDELRGRLSARPAHIEDAARRAEGVGGGVLIR
ncbi:hypothetical protein ACQEVS_31490 [Streptomyces sp. CA-181903]|uniref:hypothetical protein n=1 Tax=Streptomyces sp. CA-181903 TaxID=3240055 RepID=UPI003D8CF5E0